MKNQTHHIKKQQVNLNFETEKEARHWNSKFSAFYKREVLPQFSSLLDEKAPMDRSYVIDRLEIDLGTIRMDEFTSIFLKHAEEQIKKILKNGSASTDGRLLKGRKKKKTDESLRKNDSASERGDETDKTIEEKIFRIKNRKEHLLDCFMYFLNHGVLPWNTEIKTINELEEEIRNEVGIKEFSGRALVRKEMNKRVIRRRFNFQFSEEFVEEMFDELYSEERAVLISLKKDFEKHLLPLAKDNTSRSRIKQELSKNIWKRVVEAYPSNTGDWPEYFILSTIDALSEYLKTPEKKSSVYQMIKENLPPSSELLGHLEAISKKESSRKVRAESSGDVPDDIQDAESLKEKDVEDVAENDFENAREKDAGDINEKESHEEKQSSDKDVDKQLSQRDRDQDLSGKTESGNKTDFDEERAQAHSEVTEPNDRDTEKASAKESTKSTREPGTDDEELKKGERNNQDSSVMPPEAKKKTEFPLDSDFDREHQQDVPELLDEYYLRNAGIILTWPYLARLFENLNYLENKAFKEPILQQRSVHLLGFIGTGREKCEEHELLLAKFLTAWPLQMPVIKELELLDEEKESAGEMLQSLIQNWSVLKNTSIEGLRESFFNREGKLFKEGEQWRLIVEQESYDMLLGRLPYNISLIKLPWMDDVLQVDWA